MTTHKRIALEYIALGCGCAVISAIISTLLQGYWYLPDWYVPKVGAHHPFDDFLSIIFMLPLAMILHLLLPTGWIFWLGFGFAMRFKVRWFHFASAVPSLVLGARQPWQFWAWMSV